MPHIIGEQPSTSSREQNSKRISHKLTRNNSGCNIAFKIAEGSCGGQSCNHLPISDWWSCDTRLLLMRSGSGLLINNNEVEVKSAVIRVAIRGEARNFKSRIWLRTVVFQSFSHGRVLLLVARKPRERLGQSLHPGVFSAISHTYNIFSLVLINDILNPLNLIVTLVPLFNKLNS